MSFDFFGQGIGEESGIKFTAEQQAFFANKLPFLDPQNSKKITLGRAMSLLKFSGLSPNIQKKIFDNLKITGRGSFDYTDMKKILRGVALAQNRIEPTLINITANIKTKMPIFDDSDDDEDQEQPQEKPKPQPRNNSQPKQETPTNIPPSRPPQQPVAQQPSPQQLKPRSSQESKDGKNSNLKKFDEFWSTMTTEDNRISGGEVKKLFGNSNNRSSLSKIWKLCNTTHKGYLTKGQLYIFVMLIKNKNAQIPDKLTSQMKEIIQKIDGNNHHHKRQAQDPRKSHNPSTLKTSQFFDETVQNQSQSLSKSQNYQQKQKQAIKKNTSVEFDDFANFGMNSKPKKQTPKNNQSQKILHNLSQPFTHELKQKHSQASSPSFHPTKNIAHKPLPQVQIPPAPHIQTIPQQLPIQINNHIQKQVQILTQTIYPTIQNLSLANQKSAQILQQTNQMLNTIQQAHQGLSNKLNEIRTNQDNLNYRLNQTCIRMRDVIMKQSDFIAELLNNSEQQANMDSERVEVLEGFAQQVTEQHDQTVANYRNNNNQPHNTNIQNRQPQQNTYTNNNNNQQNYDDSYRRSLQSMKQMSMSMSKVKRKQQHSSSESSNSNIRKMYGADTYQQGLRQKLKQQAYANNNNNIMEGNNQEQQQQKQEEQPKNFDKGTYKAGVSPVYSPKHTNQGNQPIRRIQTQTQQQMYSASNANNNNTVRSPQNTQHTITTRHPQNQTNQNNIENKEQQQDQGIRIRKKQIFTIQLINFLAPIKQQEYPIILQKITNMTENQLDALYAQLYKKYEAKIAEENQKQQHNQQEFKQENKGSFINPPTQDQFSSNNFKKYDIDKAEIGKKSEEVDFFG